MSQSLNSDRFDLSSTAQPAEAGPFELDHSLGGSITCSSVDLSRRVTKLSLALKAERQRRIEWQEKYFKERKDRRRAERFMRSKYSEKKKFKKSKPSKPSKPGGIIPGDDLEKARLRRDLKIGEEYRARLREDLRILTKKYETLEEKYERLKSTHETFKRKLFGRSAERGKGQEIAKRMKKKCEANSPNKEKPSRKRRPKAYLPAEVEHSYLPAQECKCLSCGKPFIDINQDEVSDQIEMEVRAFRRELHRHKYKSTCRCPATPRIKRAPAFLRLLPKSLLGDSVWEHILVEKYFHQRPIFRIVESLKSSGLNLSLTTINDGLQKLAEIFAPLHSHMVARSLKDAHWHCDETGWSVYEGEKTSRRNHKWYLWTIVSKSVLMFYIRKSRGSNVIDDHFGEKADGIISADRYSVYRKLERDRRFIVAYCWAHTRRDFIRILDAHPEAEKWASWWIRCIATLYHVNNKRVSVTNDQKKSEHLTRRVRSILEIMSRRAANELLQKKKLNLAQREALVRLQKHWKGLQVFVDYPEIPMDNNRAENALRLEVVGRKNYNGSGSEWSAEFAALLFSLFQTLKLWKLNERLWLREAFDCIKTGRKDSLSELLPWNLSDEKRKNLSLDLVVDST